MKSLLYVTVKYYCAGLDLDLILDKVNNTKIVYNAKVSKNVPKIKRWDLLIVPQKKKIATTDIRVCVCVCVCV